MTQFQRQVERLVVKADAPGTLGDKSFYETGLLRGFILAFDATNRYNALHAIDEALAEGAGLYETIRGLEMAREIIFRFIDD